MGLFGRKRAPLLTGFPPVAAPMVGGVVPAMGHAHMGMGHVGTFGHMGTMGHMGGHWGGAMSHCAPTMGHVDVGHVDTHCATPAWGAGACAPAMGHIDTHCATPAWGACAPTMGHVDTHCATPAWGAGACAPAVGHVDTHFGGFGHGFGHHGFGSHHGSVGHVDMSHCAPATACGPTGACF